MNKHMPWNVSGFIFLVFFLCLQSAPLVWSAQVLHQINPPPSATQKETTQEPAHTAIPDLMESVRFTDPVDFCGATVPIEIPHVRKALEKEMLLMLWNRPQIILWLKRGAHYFPRRNIFDSTRAACAYIKALKTRFHFYPTALAAYNMGENGLARQIKIQETNDYYSLYLNTETRRYVYRIIAAKLILGNPEKYGFHLEPSDLYPPLDFSSITIKASRRTPIMLVAKSAGISFLTIKTLNPHIRGYYFGPGKIRFLVPKGKEKGFKKKFAQIYNTWNKKAPTAMTHVVKPGETLSGIARKYRMSTKQLLRLNRMKINKTIHPGDRLTVK